MLAGVLAVDWRMEGRAEDCCWAESGWQGFEMTGVDNGQKMQKMKSLA